MILSWVVTAAASCWPVTSGVLSLEDIAPTPVEGITTRMVRSRAAVKRNHRCGAFRVESVCQAIGCFDRLLFHDKQVVKARQPEPSEQTLEAVVQLVDANDQRASAFVGASSFSGGAHANNTLDCITVDAAGRRLGLKDLLPLPVAKAHLASAQRVAAEQGYTVHEQSVLFEPKSGIATLCALAPYPLAGTVMLLPSGAR